MSTIFLLAARNSSYVDSCGFVRVEAGLLEEVLVVEHHHRVLLPRDLVELPVRRLVLVGRVPRAGLDVVLRAGEVVERDEPALLLELRHGRRAGVEHQAGRVARGDGGTDDLLGGLAGRDLLRRHLLLGVRGVPLLDHRLAPGDLLGVVRQPHLDRAGRALGVARAGPTPTRGGHPQRQDGGGHGQDLRSHLCSILYCGSDGWCGQGCLGTGPVEARTTSRAGGRSTGLGSRPSTISSSRVAAARPQVTTSVVTVVSDGCRWAAISMSS